MRKMQDSLQFRIHIFEHTVRYDDASICFQHMPIKQRVVRLKQWPVLVEQNETLKGPYRVPFGTDAARFPAYPNPIHFLRYSFVARPRAYSSNTDYVVEAPVPYRSHAVIASKEAAFVGVTRMGSFVDENSWSALRHCSVSMGGAQRSSRKSLQSWKTGNGQIVANLDVPVQRPVESAAGYRRCATSRLANKRSSCPRGQDARDAGVTRARQ